MFKLLKSSKIYFLYFILLCIVLVSFLFTNISYDGEYQLAMAYRFIKGDKMITQMWEPHQTSAFLCTILMKFYISITHTTTGIVLFTQFMGLGIRILLAVLLFKSLQKVTDQKVAVLSAFIYIILSPKELLTPEFGNMQLWFATLMFLYLMDYIRTQKKVLLILSAIWLCLAVLSYPSMMLAYFAALIILVKYSSQKQKDLLIFTLVCAVIGALFAGYLLYSKGLNTILSCLHSALAVEPTHTVSMSDKILAHIKNAGFIFLILFSIYLLVFLVDSLISHNKKEEKKAKYIRVFHYSLYIVLAILLYYVLLAKYRGAYSYPLVMLMVLGALSCKLLDNTEKQYYFSSFLVSTFSLLATLILSDNAFLQGIPYMLLFICISLLPIYRLFQTFKDNPKIRKLFILSLHATLLVLMFRCIYLHIPISGRSQICTVFSDGAFIKSGPALGIYTNEEGACAQRDSMAEWDQYIQDGDKIWIIGEPVDTLGYLYKNVEVAAPSVMSTPSYNNELEYYFEINPDKYPTVIVLSSSFGTLNNEVLSNQWLMDFVDNHFQADQIIDGNYWRYYIKRN